MSHEKSLIRKSKSLVKFDVSINTDKTSYEIIIIIINLQTDTVNRSSHPGKKKKKVSVTTIYNHYQKSHTTLTSHLAL
jgi:hypothetical protein